MISKVFHSETPNHDSKDKNEVDSKVHQTFVALRKFPVHMVDAKAFPRNFRKLSTWRAHTKEIVTVENRSGVSAGIKPTMDNSTVSSKTTICRQ